MTDFDSSAFRHVLGHYPTGVCAVTATGADGFQIGMVVGSFSSVSLAPPLVSFFPDKRSTSWPLLEQAGKFCINILAADQEPICRQFARSGGDKFTGITHRNSDNGSPILDGVVAWIDCNMYSVHEAGDHYIVLAQVVALEVESSKLPLLFFQGKYGEFVHKLESL